jgi:hypothetical protein
MPRAGLPAKEIDLLRRTFVLFLPLLCAAVPASAAPLPVNGT